MPFTPTCVTLSGGGGDGGNGKFRFLSFRLGRSPLHPTSQSVSQSVSVFLPSDRAGGTRVPARAVVFISPGAGSWAKDGVAARRGQAKEDGRGRGRRSMPLFSQLCSMTDS